MSELVVNFVNSSCTRSSIYVWRYTLNNAREICPQIILKLSEKLTSTLRRYSKLHKKNICSCWMLPGGIQHRVLVTDQDLFYDRTMAYWESTGKICTFLFIYRNITLRCNKFRQTLGGKQTKHIYCWLKLICRGLRGDTCSWVHAACNGVNTSKNTGASDRLFKLCILFFR